MTEAEIQAVVDWWKTMSEEYKRYVIFRHERMQDPAVSEIYQIHRVMERISKAWKKHLKEKDWE